MPRVRVLLILVAAIGLVLFGLRVYQVNAEAFRIETEHYQMGEWVELEGTFLAHKAGENPEGYSIRVNSAEMLSYNEFIARHGTDKGRTIEGLDAKSVVDLELEIRNEDSDHGYIPLLRMHLIPERKNTYLIWNSDLWVENEPSSEGLEAIAIEANTEFTTHIPYTANLFDGTLAFETPITDKRFELLLANVPTRKVVDIVVP